MDPSAGQRVLLYRRTHFVSYHAFEIVMGLYRRHPGSYVEFRRWPQ